MQQQVVGVSRTSRTSTVAPGGKPATGVGSTVPSSVHASPTKGVDASFSSANRLPPLKGASMQRPKRGALDRKNSSESFMQKGQEMVHSFHEDELSRSILSGKSKHDAAGKRGSLVSGSKEDPVVDWKEAINHKDAQQANHGKFRTQATRSAVSDFLNKQAAAAVADAHGAEQHRLDAVDEVDSQMGATPFGEINNEPASFGKAAKATKLTKTPRETSQLESARREEVMGHVMNTQVAAKPTDQPNYSPMIVNLAATGNASSSFEDEPVAASDQHQHTAADALRNQD